jgi:N-glycosidase YbiA
MKVIRITKVKEESGWLSCMSPYPVTYDGVMYRTCEALFQALRFNDYPEIQKEIIECKSPMGAKMIARRERNLLGRGKMWDEAPSDIPLMKECLELKLEQHPDLKAKLIATGKAKIIEDCTTHDRESARFWGAVKAGNKWIGQNEFGLLWMEIRDQLQNQKM